MALDNKLLGQFQLVRRLTQVILTIHVNLQVIRAWNRHPCPITWCCHRGMIPITLPCLHNDRLTNSPNCCNVFLYIGSNTLKYSTITSSSAVAEWMRDASCLSVVSFNSTLCRQQSSIIVTLASDFPLHTTEFCSLLFGIFLVRGALCRKQMCNVTAPTTSVYRTLQQSLIDNQLFMQNRDLCLPHLHWMPLLRGPYQNIAMNGLVTRW